MKEDIKHIWIDALTSGEYEQAVGQLKTGDPWWPYSVAPRIKALENAIKLVKI